MLVGGVFGVAVGIGGGGLVRSGVGCVGVGVFAIDAVSLPLIPPLLCFPASPVFTRDGFCFDPLYNLCRRPQQMLTKINNRILGQ